MGDIKVEPGTAIGIDLPEGYRETEIGTLPEEWGVRRLEELISYRKGKKPKTLVEEDNYRNLPYLTANYFRTGQAKQFVPEQEVEKNIVCEEQDTVLIWDGSNSGDVFTGLRGVLASTMVKILPELPELEPTFIYFFLKTQFGLLNSQTTGSTIPHVSKNLLRNLPTPLPPLPEQRTIAHVLRTVQKAIETTEQVIESTRELKWSLMNHLFTYGPVPVDEAEQVVTRETPYGSIPEDWDEVVLGDCAYVQSGVTKGRKLEGEKAIEVPYLRVANVQDGYLDLEEIKTIHIRESELERYRLYEGDVLLTEGGDFDKLGRGFVWRGQIPDCIHQNHIFAVRADSKVLLPEYLAYLVQSRYGKAYFLQVAHRTTNLASINSTKLKALPVLVPSFPEQEEIVRILKVVDEKITVEENRKQSLEVLFKTLLHNLMTGKLRVKDLDLSEVEGMVV